MLWNCFLTQILLCPPGGDAGLSTFWEPEAWAKKTHKTLKWRGKQMRMRSGIGSGISTENQRTCCPVCGWHAAEVQPYALWVGHKVLKHLQGPDRCGSVVWASSGKAKGHRYDFRSGTRLGCGSVPDQGPYERQQMAISLPHPCFSPSLSPAFPSL